jgi:hypothetical protein
MDESPISFKDVENFLGDEKSPFTFETEHSAFRASRAGQAIVDAFELHDEGRYFEAGEKFSEVYSNILPTEKDLGAPNAEEAGHSHKSALLYQDIIEDGLDSVVRALEDEDEPTFIPEEIVEKTREYEAEHLRKRNRRGVKELFEEPPDDFANTFAIDHPVWGDVYECFERLAENMDLDEEIDVDEAFHARPYISDWEKELFEKNEGVLNNFAYNQTIFYAAHTELTWDRRETGIWEGYESRFTESELEEMYRGPAFEAQTEYFSKLSGLPADKPEVTLYAMGFLNAIESHDAHTEEEQRNNVNRMKNIYFEALEYSRWTAG